MNADTVMTQITKQKLCDQ